MKQSIVHIALVVRDYDRMQELGINFVRPPADQDYGTVAVLEDLYGDLWDLLQLNDDHPMVVRMGG